MKKANFHHFLVLKNGESLTIVVTVKLTFSFPLGSVENIITSIKRIYYFAHDLTYVPLVCTEDRGYLLKLEVI